MKKEKLMNKFRSYMNENNLTFIEVEGVNLRSIDKDTVIGTFLTSISKPKWEMQIVGSRDYHTVKLDKGLYSCTCGLFVHRKVRPCHHIKIAILKELSSRSKLILNLANRCDYYLAEIIRNNIPLANISLYSQETSMSTKFDLIFQNSTLFPNFGWIDSVDCLEDEE